MVKTKKMVVRTAIDPKRFYTLYEIAKYDLFETGSNSKTRSRNIITTDSMTRNILKACFVPDGRAGGRKYAIRGRDIIKYLAQKDDRKRI